MTAPDLSAATIAGGTSQVISDVQRAAATGDTAALSVSLDALQQFYARLWTMHDQVEAAITRNRMVREIPREPVRSEHVIAGVYHALWTARDLLSSTHEGLERSLVRLRRLLEKNLDAIYQAYSSYLTTDAESAAQLGTATGGLTEIGTVGR